MSVFVDSSAWVAYFDVREARHAEVVATISRLRAEREELVTTSYVAVETSAVIQRRRGFTLARDTHSIVLRAARVVWVDSALHEEGVDLWAREGRRLLSLVDCVSFACMRRERLTRALAVDPHFAEQGFDVIPS